MALFLTTSVHSNTLLTLPLELRGNWFLQENTNIWAAGIYGKYFYFKNEFWKYSIVSKKNKEWLFLLEKEKVKLQLSVTIINDSTIQLKNGKVIQLLTKKLRRMAVRDLDVPLKHIGDKKKVWIKGYIDHRSLTSLEQIELLSPDLIEGRMSSHIATIDKDGRFDLSFSLNHISPNVIVHFGGVFENVFIRPGDTAIVYIDILPYSSAKNEDEFSSINCKLAVAGNVGPFNNEYIQFRRYIKAWDDDTTRNEIIHNSDQETYMKYELARNQFMDSLVVDYRSSFSMNSLLFETVQHTNKYHLANWLYRYRWLHEKDKEVKLNANYIHLLDSFTRDDSNAYLGGTEFNGFLGEVLNRFIGEQLFDRDKVDHFINANSSFIRSLEYIEKYDNSLNEDYVRKIDSLKLIAPVITFNKGRSSLKFNIRDSIEAKIIEVQFGHVLKYLDGNDYRLYYYGGIELIYGLSKIDSFFSKGIFRDYLIGRYVYNYFVQNNRIQLDHDVINVLKPMCSDSIAYTLIVQSIVENERKHQDELQENLATPIVKGKKTILNKIAQENRGKVIYIDLWATWCAPCIKQFGYSEQLKKQLEGKPVVFVYLCGDSNKSEWERSIKKHGLSGQHFLLSTGEVYELREKYQFNSYPRYMIIDKVGKMFSTNTFRPENTVELMSTFNYLLN